MQMLHHRQLFLHKNIKKKMVLNFIPSNFGWWMMKNHKGNCCNTALTNTAIQKTDYYVGHYPSAQLSGFNDEEYFCLTDLTEYAPLHPIFT
jgi:hypothetical protein